MSCIRTELSGGMMATAGSGKANKLGLVIEVANHSLEKLFEPFEEGIEVFLIYPRQ